MKSPVLIPAARAIESRTTAVEPFPLVPAILHLSVHIIMRIFVGGFYHLAFTVSLCGTGELVVIIITYLYLQNNN